MVSAVRRVGPVGLMGTGLGLWMWRGEMGPMLGLWLDLVLDLVALLVVLMRVTPGLDPGLIWPVPVVHLVLVCLSAVSEMLQSKSTQVCY